MFPFEKWIKFGAANVKVNSIVQTCGRGVLACARRASRPLECWGASISVDWACHKLCMGNWI